MTAPINRDIAEFRAVEEALHISQQRLAWVLDTTGIGLWFNQLPFGSLNWDNRTRELFFLPPGVEPTIDIFWQRLHPDDREPTRLAVEAAIENRTLYSIDHRAVDPETGEVRWIRSAGKATYDADGTPIRFDGINYDITQAKRTETALENTKENLENIVQARTNFLIAANQELEARTNQLRRLAGELTMTEQRERRRLAKILHDGLQQYLVAAKLQAGELLGKAADTELRQAVGEIEHLLGESILVSRSLVAEITPPVLHEGGLSAGLEWLSRWMFDKYQLKVELLIKDDASALSEDVKVFLFEALRELLLNVVKHAGTYFAQVRLDQNERKQLRVVVSDRGRGFDGDEKLFAGTYTGGFGLFSIRERISLIGGSFETASAPGKGASFTLTVPLDAGDPAQSDSKTRADAVGKDHAAAVTDPGGKIRILLVDDHPVMREGLARLLGNEAGFEVVGQASNGREAIENVRLLHPDVVLMDINMPYMNGIEATRHIRQRHPDVRVIGLSLYSEEEIAKEVLAAGAVFYISKSSPPAELKAAIQACMGGMPKGAEAAESPIP